MKYSKSIILVFISFLACILLISCQSPDEEDTMNAEEFEQYIKVEKRIGDQNSFEDFKTISNHEQVEKVREILKEAEWEKAKVEREGPPEYQFMFIPKESTIEAKAVLYQVWIRNNILNIDSGDNHNTQLDDENSKLLFDILIGENNAK